MVLEISTVWLEVSMVAVLLTWLVLDTYVKAPNEESRRHLPFLGEPMGSWEAILVPPFEKSGRCKCSINKQCHLQLSLRKRIRWGFMCLDKSSYPSSSLLPCVLECSVGTLKGCLQMIYLHSCVLSLDVTSLAAANTTAGSMLPGAQSLPPCWP